MVKTRYIHPSTVKVHGMNVVRNIAVDGTINILWHQPPVHNLSSSW